MRNGEVSFWQASLGPPPRRPSLPGPSEADVCVVGAGYTGLWTAWAVRRADPTLRVVVLEADHVGFGASGRNGGWLSGLLPGNRAVLARGAGGRSGVIGLQHHLFAAVDEVAAVCEDEGIDADLHVGGSLAVATGAAQLARLRAELDADRAWGVGPVDAWPLSATEVAERVRVADALGGIYTPHCARIHPAKLVRGLAEAAARAGAEIYEATPVTSIGPHVATTTAGAVRARWVVRATEGFTARLPGLRRRLLPMNSSMVVTAPLPPDAWAAIGWRGAETVRD
ncbi:MAG: NAD(P)/FAD-dependent oxidoreductase, partial [Actinomycetes bacterium]